MKRTALLALLLSTIAHADEWGYAPFVRPKSAPVISPDKAATFVDPVTKKPVHWEALHTFNPAAVMHDGKIAVLYRAEDDSGQMAIGGHTSRLGLAESTDGVTFTKLPQPVLYPAVDAQQKNEEPGGVEDPRLVQAPDGTYVLTYTQWSRDRAVYTVGLATSKDLRSWQKLGPIFDGRAGYEKYKSAGIVTKLDGERLVAAKVNGKFWMYWGEIHVHLAWSTDLLHWTPVEEKPGVPHVLLEARRGLFDSGFPETGPPPLLTKKGIVMLYNAKNSEGADGDTSLPAGGYSVGEALFSAKDPGKLLERRDKPVFKPEVAFEKSGQYAAGTTFAEGLVYFGKKWWMYYGCADSLVGVAVSDRVVP